MCFNLGWIEHLLIWLVIIGAVVALVKLLLPMVFKRFGEPGQVVLAAIDIVIWAFIAIMVIVFVFDLVSCLLGGGITAPHMLR